MIYINAEFLIPCSCPTANLVLQDTIERLYAGNLYADIPRGVYLVRGENVLLLGEIVSSVFSNAPRTLMSFICVHLLIATEHAGPRQGRRDPSEPETSAVPGSLRAQEEGRS